MADSTGSTQSVKFAYNFSEVPPSDVLRECYRDLDRRGWDSAWFPEARDHDAVTLAAVALADTQNLKAGTAILPVATRSPLLLAMTSQTLVELFGDRFILGIGASTETVAHNWHGMPYDPAPSSLVETTQLVRGFLKGERQNRSEGRYAGMRGAGLGHTISSSIPIIWASLGPKSVRLAAEHADGFLLNFPTANYVREQVEKIDPARRSSVIKMANVACTFAKDPEPAIAAFRRYVANYGAAPAYNRHFAREGFVDEAAGMKDAWSKRDGKAAMAAVSEKMVEDLFPMDEAGVKRRIDGLAAAGLDVALFIVIGSDHREAIERLDSVRTGK